MLINSSEHWPVPDVSIADRDFFKQLKSAPAAEPVAMQLVQGRFSQALGNRNRAQGDGTAWRVPRRRHAGIEPANFEKFFASVALAPGASISMHHRDGTLLARYPHVEDMIGRNFRTGTADQQRVFEQDQVTTRLISPIDGQDRLIASRMLADFPIVIIATTTVSAALADWREQIEVPDRVPAPPRCW